MVLLSADTYVVPRRCLIILFLVLMQFLYQLTTTSNCSSTNCIWHWTSFIGMRVSTVLFASLLPASQSFTFQGPRHNNGVFIYSKIGYPQTLGDHCDKQQSHNCRGVPLQMSSNVDYAEAEDIKSLKSLFSQYSDDSDSMTKETLCKVPPFDEMLVRQAKWHTCRRRYHW